MKKKWFSALAALAVLSFAAAPMNGYAVDEESLDDELAVAVTTEAPVIAGTVVTTDTPPQITSNVSETSMTTTVTDEYGNYIDEEGNITPATTSVSTQTETTMTTTTVTSDALSEEQEKALAELAEKEHGVFGEFERARASILNKIKIIAKSFQIGRDMRADKNCPALFIHKFSHFIQNFIPYN